MQRSHYHLSSDHLHHGGRSIKLHPIYLNLCKWQINLNNSKAGTQFACVGYDYRQICAMKNLFFSNQKYDNSWLGRLDTSTDLFLGENEPAISP